MKVALGTWSAVCVGAVAVAFFGAPAWDTEAEGLEFISGSTVFFLLAVFVILAWLAGAGVIVLAAALLQVYGPKRFAASIVAGLAVLGIAGLVVASRGGEDGHRSSFVSFDTVDADPDWSPNGRLVAFTSSRGRGGIYVVRPNGTGMRRVFPGDARDVDWSPDGTAIAYAGRRGIYVLRLRDRETRLVLEGEDVSLPVWAPNGMELALVKEERGTYRSYDGPIEGTASAIYVVRLDGSGLRRLLPRHRSTVGGARPGSIGAAMETEPTWSPDGRRVAFQAGDGKIVIADVVTGRRVDVAGGYEPAWSPDGRLIAYQCMGSVCVARADGKGGGRELASDGGDPSWSPNSRQLVFERYLYGGAYFGSSPQSLSIVRADGGALRELTYGPR